MLPVMNTCKAFIEDIDKCVRDSLNDLPILQDEHVKSHPFTYSCIFKQSNNKSLCRDDIFRQVGTFLQSKSKDIKVNFDKPDYVLVMQVIGNICFVSFVKNYFQYRKYNLLEMSIKHSLDNTENNAKNKTSQLNNDQQQKEEEEEKEEEEKEEEGEESKEVEEDEEDESKEKELELKSKIEIKN
jgi:flagellar biosynthesis GTPase FlhF